MNNVYHHGMNEIVRLQIAGKDDLGKNFVFVAALPRMEADAIKKTVDEKGSLPLTDFSLPASWEHFPKGTITHVVILEDSQ
jgi:hypothetical protein